jgi:hypothetical protein
MRSEIIERFCGHLHQDYRIIGDRIEKTIDDFLVLRNDADVESFIVEMMKLIDSSRSDEDFRSALYDLGAHALPDGCLRGDIKSHIERIRRSG